MISSTTNNKTTLFIYGSGMIAQNDALEVLRFSVSVNIIDSGNVGKPLTA